MRSINCFDNIIIRLYIDIDEKEDPEHEGPFCDAQLFIDFLNLLLKLSFLCKFLGRVPVFSPSWCGSAAARLLKEAGSVLYLSSLSGNLDLILKSLHFFSSLLDLENLDPISLGRPAVSDLKVKSDSEKVSLI